MKRIGSILCLILCFLTLLAGCIDEQTMVNEKKDDANQFNWSTMNEGPYGDQISYATSTDLLNWTDSKEILAIHASVPGAVYRDGVIYVYFVDVSVDGIPERLGLIMSEDNAQTWTEKQYITIEGVGDKVPVDPAPYLLDNGQIRLYYFDIDEERSFNENADGTNKIYSAVSTDGISFIEEGVCFSKEGVYDPDVIRVDDVWRLYVGDIAGNKVVSATSSDGLSFVEEGTAFTGGAVPDVFFTDGTYYLYTAGIDISTSSDGSSFTKTPYRFESEINPLTADPSVIERDDGIYMMVYKTEL